MQVITLPDGSQRTFDRPVTVAEVAADMGRGLARAALAGELDGRLVDTAHEIAADAKLRIITSKDLERFEAKMRALGWAALREPPMFKA